MKNAAIALAVLLGAVSVVADAHAQTRVRGNITSVSGDTLAVKTAEGKAFEIQVTDKTNIIFGQPMKLSDIKSGDFLAITSVKHKDGTLTAYDVRRMMKPSNPGHRPFDDREDQTMTNATVSATVQGAKGHELTMSYEGGSQKVIVADSAVISALGPGQRSQLVPGAYVSVLAEPGADGKLTARSAEVRKETPIAPM